MTLKLLLSTGLFLLFLFLSPFVLWVTFSVLQKHENTEMNSTFFFKSNKSTESTTDHADFFTHEYQEEENNTLLGSCPIELVDYVGDQLCDDSINIKDCDYDGGDCCGKLIFTHDCVECICYETLNKTLALMETCPSELINKVGDQLCDDSTNIPECHYDDGDCCGDFVFNYNCIQCICLENEINSS